MDNIYENTHFEMGKGKIGQALNFEFKFLGNKKPVHVRAGCGGCTYPYLTENGDITGYVVLRNALGVDNTTNKNRTGEFTKSLTVYLDDGLPLQEINAKGNKTFNKNKSYITLTLSGEGIE